MSREIKFRIYDKEDIIRWCYKYKLPITVVEKIKNYVKE